MGSYHDNTIKECEIALSKAQTFFHDLIAAPRVLINFAAPPERNGVYAFSIEDEIIYIGEAAGSLGLRNRILGKHVSGDEGHALQSAYKLQYPDRGDRRRFIKENICVQWVEVPDSLMVSLVEKLAICVLKPKLNKSVQAKSVR